MIDGTHSLKWTATVTALDSGHCTRQPHLLSVLVYAPPEIRMCYEPAIA